MMALANCSWPTMSRALFYLRLYLFNTYHISDTLIEMPLMYQGIPCLPTVNMQDQDQDPNLKRSQRKSMGHGSWNWYI